jgi:hypothetical protein
VLLAFAWRVGVGGRWQGAVVIRDNDRRRRRRVEPDADAGWGLADWHQTDLRLLRDQGGQGRDFPERESVGLRGLGAVVYGMLSRERA